ncbi:MAG: prenyltransferase [Deltaproteobacteria bacterium]|nr:prenyltransferase [Deltaproteobacteria bacterium]
MGRLKTLILATRPQFLPAIAAPVGLGAAVAWRLSGEFSPALFAITLFAALCYHAGMNVLNDYYDSRNGADGLNLSPLTPFAGGSRFIQNGLLTQRDTLYLGAALLAAGTAAGLYLAWAATPLILVIGGLGLLSGYFYSAPPLFLAGRGLGEAIVGIDFGLLTVVGACMAQTKGLHIEAAVASLPLSFLIVAILVVNEFPDFESDSLSGKRNLVVRLGRRTARYGLLAIALFAFASVIIGVLTGFMPPLSLIALLGVIPALRGSLLVMKVYDDKAALLPAIKSIILSHLATGLLQITALVLTIH